MVKYSNNTDLLALHYVFIPRINLQLDEFHQTYSHHRLHTARNQSPFQKWVRGFNQQSGDDAALQGVLGDALVKISNCSTIDMLSLSKVGQFKFISKAIIHMEGFSMSHA